MVLIISSETARFSSYPRVLRRLSIRARNSSIFVYETPL
jgi:hypothetical protein